MVTDPIRSKNSHPPMTFEDQTRIAELPSATKSKDNMKRDVEDACKFLRRRGHEDLVPMIIGVD